ncbi:Card1-like endonuclease domain-containing protein [Helicobacter pylori]|uniref:Card1-like endonuclease domain-containing protein n=1 Tax=Helicobacter pylori TaxID=210 RepID=UPI002FBD555C
MIYDLRLNMILGVENMTAVQEDKCPIYTELDIAFSDGKNLYVVECKSGELKNKGVLTALSTNTQIFGGANAKCILVASDTDILSQNIQERIKNLNIKLISRDFKKNIENYINNSRR